ncbi:AtzE family amidohydrolase, partial [Xanthomonas perforans]|nr:AtzE family amidohydrolase [Xanthomonas perforans]
HSTHRALLVDRMFPFVDTLHVVAPFASSVSDLRRVYEVMCGHALPSRTTGNLRIARLGGWFQRNLDPDLDAGLEALLTACNSTTTIELPEAERARAAAFVLTAAEGAHRHRSALHT